MVDETEVWLSVTTEAPASYDLSNIGQTMNKYGHHWKHSKHKTVTCTRPASDEQRGFAEL
jgi:hypothetical protein